MNDPDTTKKRLFDILESRKEEFDYMVSRDKYGDIVRAALRACENMVSDAEDLKVVATGLLHYIITRAAIPSQRKVDAGDTFLDIVIPGIRDMRRRPQSTLIILICGDCSDVQERMGRVKKIQPNPDNLWLLAQDCQTMESPCYTIRESMADMVEDMIRFAREHNQHKLGLTV